MIMSTQEAGILKFLTAEQISKAAKDELPFRSTLLALNASPAEISGAMKGYEGDTMHIYVDDKDGNLHNGTAVRITKTDDDPLEFAHIRYTAAEELSKLKPRGIVFARDKSLIPPDTFLHNGD